MHVRMYYCSDSSADVVLKSGTLDRRTYKGKAQLCKSVVMWTTHVHVAKWFMTMSYVFSLPLSPLSLFPQPLAPGTVGCLGNPLNHLLQRNPFREYQPNYNTRIDISLAMI